MCLEEKPESKSNDIVIWKFEITYHQMLIRLIRNSRKIVNRDKFGAIQWLGGSDPEHLGSSCSLFSDRSDSERSQEFQHILGK